MKQIELFAGIGGFGLAGHWAGIETVCQVEIDKFCQQVLAKNFTNARRHDDIHTFDGTEYAGTVDIISGGFPCQPYSAAGKRKGNKDDRALWPQMLRIIREVRPRWVVGENVAGLLTMDGGQVFDEICTSLENEGYQTQAFVIPACAVGAPHRRDRVWIIGRYTSNSKGEINAERQDFNKWEKPIKKRGNIQLDIRSNNRTNTNPNPGSPRLQRSEQRSAFEQGEGASRPTAEFHQITSQWAEHWYEAATRLCRMDDGISGRVDRHRAKRLKALGNAIVPQVAYIIFEAIKEYENQKQ